MRYLTPLLALVLAACMSAPPGPPRDSPTLLVINESLTNQLRIYASGHLIGIAERGANCLSLRAVPDSGRATALEFRESVRGQSYFAPAERLDSREGWLVHYGMTPEYDLLSLQPTARCREL